MLPWLGSLLLLVFHLPTCIIRAIKWESAQYLVGICRLTLMINVNTDLQQALGLASLGIALTIQAYVSTSMRAAEVLVWMPLTLVLDAGAMLQMFVLIIEKHDRPYRAWMRLKPVERQGKKPPRGYRVLWDAVRKLMRDAKAFLTGKQRRGQKERGDGEAQNGTYRH
jgi:hypothetical protein